MTQHPTPAEREAALERCIDLAHNDLVYALDDETRRAACVRLTQLVSSRSPEVVAALEEARGLR